MRTSLAKALGVDEKRVFMPQDGNAVNRDGKRISAQYAIKEKVITREPPTEDPQADVCTGLLDKIASMEVPESPTPAHIDKVFRSNRPAEMVARGLVGDGTSDCFHHVRAHVDPRGFETRAWVELRVPRLEVIQDGHGGVIKTGDLVEIGDEKDLAMRFPFRNGKFAGTTDAQPFVPSEEVDENGKRRSNIADTGSAEDSTFLRVWPEKEGKIDESLPPALVPARLVFKHKTTGLRKQDLAQLYVLPEDFATHESEGGAE
ncbi:unnamed protein product, partial [Amoebophrya sp. A120]|eukprot:GSA120T00004979001.1